MEVSACEGVSEVGVTAFVWVTGGCEFLECSLLFLFCVVSVMKCPKVPTSDFCGNSAFSPISLELSKVPSSLSPFQS